MSQKSKAGGASEAGDHGEPSTPAKDGGKVEGSASVAIKEAINGMLKGQDLAPIARWAKVKDSAEPLERKPVLNSIVALHRRELKQQPPIMAAPKTAGGDSLGGTSLADAVATPLAALSPDSKVPPSPVN